MTAIKRGNEIVLDEVAASADIDHHSADGKRGENGRVQLASRVLRERQKTHQDVASGEEGGKLVRAGKKRDAGNPLARPAPHSQLESDWLESTQCSDAQHAGPHDSHAPQ